MLGIDPGCRRDQICTQSCSKRPHGDPFRDPLEIAIVWSGKSGQIYSENYESYENMIFNVIVAHTFNKNGIGYYAATIKKPLEQILTTLS